MLKFFNDMFAADTPLNLKVTFVIALLGFAISLISGGINIFRQRKNFDIIIHSVKAYDTVIFLNVSFVNKSRLPLLITRVALLHGDAVLECTAIPVKVAAFTNRRGDEVLSHREVFSKALPVALSSLGGDAGIILFENVQEQLENDATRLTFLIGANRGRTVKRTLSLPANWVSRRTVA